MSLDLSAALVAAFGPRARRHVLLGPLTTFRVGGPADWLVDVHDAGELRRLVAIARDAGAPLAVLGGGSNTLVADEGVRGVVARIHGGQVRLAGDSCVRADGGVTINGLVRWTIGHGLAGLESWAGTPGTVGGAIHGNAHFQGRLIAELVTAVTLLSLAGEVRDVPVTEMDFGYDYSRLHRTREIVLAADFRVHPGDPAELRRVARASLAFRKRTQPLAHSSAGCVFQNPPAGVLPAAVPASAGALVDRAGMKGVQLGGAQVSPVHANFIVNTGQASAADIRALIDRCRQAVADRFGVRLEHEVIFLGFPDEVPGRADEQETG